MNILQQIWTYSNVVLTFLVNLVHTVSLVPVIDHDMVAVGEIASFCRHVHKRRSNRRLPESTLATSSRTPLSEAAIW